VITTRTAHISVTLKIAVQERRPVITRREGTSGESQESSESLMVTVSCLVGASSVCGQVRPVKALPVFTRIGNRQPLAARAEQFS